MSRIVCISNRVSLPDPETGKIKAGGLAVGVKSAIESNGGGVWFGWDGSVCETHSKRSVTQSRHGDITFLTIPLFEKEYEQYYKGMANESLWPLLHSLGHHVNAKADVYQTYKNVNKLFAKMVKPHLRPDDIIWVHDYHLIPLGKELRTLGIKNAIGYFNHTPMPSQQFLNSGTIPERLRERFKTLTRDLFDYDLVGFQTFRDLENFCSTINMPCKKPQRYSCVDLHHKGKSACFGVFPISIETHDLVQSVKKAAQKQAQESAKEKERTPACKTLIGAERLDYTKGLTHRLNGYYEFLNTHPEYSTKVKYHQITPLSRADIAQYKATIEKTREVAQKIIDEHSVPNHQPLLYSEDGLPREELMLRFRAADAALVTPIIDGQNLVAKEYLAAQNPQDPGMLILSRTAGAAEELEELGILCVDPQDPEDIAAKIHTALTMPRAKRMELYQKAISHLYQYDIEHWVESFLGCMKEITNAKAPATRPVSRPSQNRLHSN